MSEQFEPLIIGFTCNWCSYRAADLAGISRRKYAHNIRLIRLMCSGRLDPSFVLKAFAGGADGVMVSGCHPGECHYLEQNYKMWRRYLLLKRMLVQLGIEPKRLKLLWASAAEGIRFADEVTKMVEEVRTLGPLNWSANGLQKDLSKKLGSAAPAVVPQQAAAAKPAVPGSKPAVPAAKPTVPLAAKPAGPPSAMKPAGPQPAVKPAGPPSAVKPAGPPSGVKPAGPPPAVKPAGPPPAAKEIVQQHDEQKQQDTPEEVKA